MDKTAQSSDAEPHSATMNIDSEEDEEDENNFDDDDGEEEADEEDGGDDDRGNDRDGELEHHDTQQCPTWKGSLVEYYGQNMSYCGYCKSSDSGRRSSDMNTFRLTVADYQELIDLGWRRSGKYCYHPNNPKSCCPNYSITCNTTKFRLSSSQRKCIMNMNSFLISGSVETKVNLNYHANSGSVLCNLFTTNSSHCLKVRQFEQLKASSKAKARRFVRSCERLAKTRQISVDDAMVQIRGKWTHRQPVVVALEDYLYPKVASLTVDKSQAETFKPKHRLTTRLCQVNSKFCIDCRKDEHALMVRYQKAVHKEDRKEWTMSRYCDFLVDSPLVTEPLTNFSHLSTRSSDEDKDDNFSINTMGPTSGEYLSFKPPELPTAYGTFHCHYFLDDKLIAVGVLDVLPKCISTVYFFYDPDYAFLNLGIYSALVEISLVRSLCLRFVGPMRDNKMIHYYLGFYVHECKKMHYKTRFRPSYLLCSETYQYIATEECLKKLVDGVKYARFSSDDNHASTTPTVSLESSDKIMNIPVCSPVSPDNHDMMSYLIWLDSNLGSDLVTLLINVYLVPYMQLIDDELIKRLCLRLTNVHRMLVQRARSKQAAGSSRG